MSILSDTVVTEIFRNLIRELLGAEAELAKEVLNTQAKELLRRKTDCVMHELREKHILAEEGVVTRLIVVNGLFHLFKCLGIRGHIRIAFIRISIPGRLRKIYDDKVLDLLDERGLTAEQGKSTEEIVEAMEEALVDVVF